MQLALILWLYVMSFAFLHRREIRYLGSIVTLYVRCHKMLYRANISLHDVTKGYLLIQIGQEECFSRK